MQQLTSDYLHSLQYDPQMSPQELFARHREFGESFPQRSAPLWLRGDKVRVGYVSADFCGHACANFLLPTLKSHDRNRVEVFLYANNKVSDFITEEFQKLGVWRPIRGISDEDVATQIASDKIDILMDCSGHTAGKRITLFARRPAPVAATFLGYAGLTTGLTQIDYRLTDSINAPFEEENAFACEKVIRLPNGVLTFAPHINVDEAVSQNPPVLTNGYITFGSFNRPEKTNDHVVRLWAELLRAVPHSRLLLKSEGWQGNTLDHERVQVIAQRQTYRDHYAAYSAIDIALDTFPFGGLTTTCDALWMGVPVITLLGNRHSSRMSASLLTRVGLTDMIAQTPEEYVAKAAELAADIDKLVALRRSMRQRILASPLGNPALIARDLEDFYDLATSPETRESTRAK